MTKGWKNESQRHSLASRGIKSGQKSMVAVGRKDWTSSLSKEGKRLYDKYGFFERYVPFIWEEEMKSDTRPSSPHYITVDFVLDAESLKDYEATDEEEQDEWLSHNLDFLIRKGFIVDVYEGGISSPEELKEKYDDMLLIYGRN